MDLHHHSNHHLTLSKSSHHRSNEWIFRDVPSDITIEVNGVEFALHKFPLVSRSGRIRKLVSENRDTSISRVELLSLPGGPKTFELAAKFCYGNNFEITPANVAQLCCVSDYLEMTEDFSNNNLGSRADEYLNHIVCQNLEMSVEVLRHCESLLPLADELRIVPRCIDAIASKACVEQIALSFSRLEYSGSGRLNMSRQKCESDWWVKDLSVLRIDLYQRVITAMKCRGVRPESIAESLMSYAEKELTKKPNTQNISGSNDHERAERAERLVVETIVGLLPVEKLIVSLSFLFGLLRSAGMLDCSVACRLDLERRIGSQLDIATVDDLLIPCFRQDSDTLFDVDTVHRILVNFSQQDDYDDGCDEEDGSGFESEGLDSPSETALFKVSKLVDSYLAEIAPDGGLKVTKFVGVAESLPARARMVHDGLYRAIDVYLKVHPFVFVFFFNGKFGLLTGILHHPSDHLQSPSGGNSPLAHQGLSESDKKKICKLIDFHKLSPEASAHAAQNERLPLQSIVQVLYIEQLRLKNALYSSDNHKPPQSWRITSGALSAAMSPKDNYASLRRENRELKLELARLRMRLNDLEKEHVCMKRNMEKSSSRKFMSSLFSKKISKLIVFGNSSSRGSSSPSRNS
ncbi:hypothetical protein SSX86_011263 [Deinandra increscens subsp. villosa]|uniref:Phototropic-responsive NPH3 family protein n=1 Tax=Deinandra increscens subsp. villosa TaxID=3103831 RepID=A0AAP0H495_9ASTR